MAALQPQANVAPAPSAPPPVAIRGGGKAGTVAAAAPVAKAGTAGQATGTGGAATAAASPAAVPAAAIDAKAAEGDASCGEASSPDDSAANPLAPATFAAAGDAPDATADPGVRGAPDTVASFSAEMARRLDGRDSRFTIGLDPDGLGHVAVAMQIGGDGKLTASLSFDQADAASLVGGRADELRAALAQSGFHLAADALRFDVAPQPPAGTAAAPLGAGGQNGGWSAGSDGSGSQSGGGGSPRPPPPALGFLASASDHPTSTAAGGLDIRI